MKISPAARRAALPLASTLALTVVGIGVAAPAHATNGISRCTGQDRVVQRSVALTKNAFVATQLVTINVGPGVKYSRSTTLIHQTTLSASATGAVEASGGIHWKFIDLGAKVSGSITASVSHTTTGSVTESVTLPTRSKTTKWVIYQGHRDVRGNWYQLTCSRAPGHGTEYRGAVKSFGVVAKGAILCNHRLYKTGSEGYVASRAAGC
jgi:hypothetical protein